MAKTEFVMLRDTLESGVVQPEFALIRARRLRRTRRGTVSIVVLVAVVIASVGLLVRLPATAAKPTAQGVVSSRVVVIGSIVRFGDTLYATVGVCHGHCPAGTYNDILLRVSTDGGATWTNGVRLLLFESPGATPDVGTVIAGPTGPDLTDPAYWYVLDESVYSATLGGGSARIDSISDFGGGELGPMLLNQGIAWFGFGNRLYYDRVGQAFVQAALPPGVQSVDAIVPTVSADSGAIYVYATIGGRSALVRTGTGAQSAAELAVPCPADQTVRMTDYPSSAFAQCRPPARGYTTVDGGRHWSIDFSLERDQGFHVSGSTIEHTNADGVSVSVSPTGDPVPAQSFSASDFDHAAYADPVTLKIYVTDDGGATWRTVTPPD